MPFVGLPSGIFRPASFMRHAISLALTYISPEFGSNATPPHSPPPSMPGKRIVPCVLGGSYSPRFLSLSHSSRTACSAAGVRFVIRSSVNCCRVKGGGSVGSTCVGAACSPSTSEAGGVTVSIGKIGSPVSRSRT